MLGLSQAMLVALGTASSSATLPLTINCCEQNNGLSQRTVRFMLPLGGRLHRFRLVQHSESLIFCSLSPPLCVLLLLFKATINMNGTALYESVAAIFVAQLVGMDLNLGKVPSLWPKTHVLYTMGHSFHQIEAVYI